MIFVLIHFLNECFGISLPAVFTYSSTRMLLAAVTSLAISIFLGPLFIRQLHALRIGQVIRKDHVPLLAELHEKKEDTPTMGGLLILASMLVALFLWMDLTHVFTLILLMTTLVLGAVGARDDYLKLKHRNSKGLSGKKKLLAQGLFATVFALYLLVPQVTDSIHFGSWYAPPKVLSQSDGLQQLSTFEYITQLYFPFFKHPLLLTGGIGAIAIGAFILFVVIGTSNAVNLTDGLDGLAAGCLVMVASTFGLIAFLSNHLNIAGYLNILYIEGAAEIAIYLSAFVGACLGFLWYNGHPAQVFMGDTGSLALGGIIGVSAVLMRRELLLGLVGGVFVAETLSVILQVGSWRLRKGKRLFLCAPLHHHFEYKGWPETKVVIRFWIIGLLLAFIGLGSLKFQ